MRSPRLRISIVADAPARTAAAGAADDRAAFTEVAASYDNSVHIQGHPGGPNAALIGRDLADNWLIHSRPGLHDLVTRWGREVVSPLRSARV